MAQLAKVASKGIASALKSSKIRFQPPTIDRIVVLAATADEPSARLSSLVTFHKSHVAIRINR